MEDSPAPVSRHAQWLIAHARTVGAVVALGTLLALAGIPRLSFSDNPRDLFARDDEASRRLASLHESFGADDTQIVILLEGDAVLERDALGRLWGLVEELRADPDLVEVYSLLDARRAVRLRRSTAYWMIVPPPDREDPQPEQTRAKLLEHPLLRERMISADGQMTVVLAQMDDSLLEVSSVAEVSDRVTEAARRAFDGSPISVQVAGSPLLRVETLYNLKTDQVTFSVLCGATLFLIALALFRKIQPVIVSLAGPGVGVLWLVGAMGWAGQRMDGLNVVLPTLMLVIGFTDSLHLVMAMRALRRAGHTPREASAAAVALVGRACLLTSITTAIGFGSLSLSSLASVHRFGLYSAAGAIGLYVAVITIVPLLPLLPWLGDLGPTRDSAGPPNHRLLNAIGQLIVRRRRSIAAASVVATVLLALAARQVEYDMHWSEAIPDGSSVVQTTERLDDVFGGSIFAHVVVEWPEGESVQSDKVLAAVADLQDALASFASPSTDLPLRLGQPISLLTILEGLRPEGGELTSGLTELRRRMPDRYRRLVREDQRRLLINVPVPDGGARALMPMFDAIDKQLEYWQSRHAGYSAELTGSTVLSARNLNDVIHELYRSVLAAAGVVFVVLCFAFRSLRLGLISVVPNVFPLLALTATLALTGTPMQVTATLTLCLSLGIAVDDTIHLVERFRHETDATPRDAGAACRRAFTAVGKVIVLTTIVLVSGFATMLASGSPAIRLFGGATCVALTAALIGDLLFLPALLVVGSRKAPRDPRPAV